MWRHPTHDPSPYDDDWEDQPAQSAFHQWGLGFLLPALLLAYAVYVFVNGQAQFGGRHSMTLRGPNAVAYAIVAAAVSLFLHCHYFWGNVYNQAWAAVLGKIISLCAAIGGMGFLLVRVGVLGRT